MSDIALELDDRAGRHLERCQQGRHQHRGQPGSLGMYGRRYELLTGPGTRRRQYGSDFRETLFQRWDKPGFADR